MNLLRPDQIIQFAFSGASDPTATDDSNAGYLPGHRWLNTSTKRIWVNVDATVGAAVWREDTPDSGTADFSKILVAIDTGVTSSHYPQDVPLIVVDNQGNLVTKL